jgi:hypothetical protein
MSTVYYFSPTGSDSNSGTSPASPWQTLTRANQVAYQAGDSLLFQGGATFNGSLVLTGVDGGTQAAPITVSSYGSGRATISSAGADGIDIVDTSGVNVVNINVAGNGTNLNTSTGINLMDTQVNQPRLGFIIITAVDVGGYGAAGIGINSKTLNTGFQDIIITNCTVHNNGHSGIWSQAGADVAPAPYGLAHQGIYIGYDTVFNNQGYAGSDASGNGIQIGDANACTIEHCTAYGNGTKNNSTVGGGFGIWTYNSNSICIQYNESYSNYAKWHDGGGFDLDGGTTNSTLQYNYTHDNAGSGILEAQFGGAAPHTGNVIRFNISKNDGRLHDQAGIELWSASATDTIVGTQIYNNTVYMAPATTGTPQAILVVSYTKNVDIRNNIFAVGAGLKTVNVTNTGSGLLFQDNDYWTGSASAINVVWGGATYQTLAAFQSGAKQETLSNIPVGRAYNPVFNIASSNGVPSSSDVITSATAFTLKSNSPLTKAGIDLPEIGVDVGTLDYFSDELTPGLMPIGAYY